MTIAHAVESQPGSRINGRRLFGGIGSAEGFNPIGILLYAIPGLLSTIVFDRNRFGGDFRLWLIMGALGYAVAVAMYFAGGAVYRRLIPRFGEHPFWVQGYFAVIGLARALVIFWLGTEWKLIPPGDWLFRLVGGPIFTGVTLGIGVILGINFSRSAAEGRRLNAERLRLRELQQSMNQRIETQRAELAGRVQGILAPAIAAVRAQLANAAASKEVLNTLNHTVDEVVRPLSHSIANADAVDIESAQGAKKAKRWAISIWHPVEAKRVVIPQLSAILITISSLPAAVAIKPGPGGFSIALVQGVTTLIVLSLLRLILSRAVLPLALAGLLVTATFVLAEFFVVLILGELGLHITRAQAIDVCWFGLIFGLFFAVGQSVQTARGVALAELGKITESLAILVSRLRQEIWLNNRRMAGVLHGPVQAALYAAGMKLSGSKAVSLELITEVERDIASALERLDSEHRLEGEDFAETLNQIVSLWRGCCEISVFTTDECSQALYADRNAAACVVEVVQEAISNAIKHGRASNASVMISLVSPKLAEVRVRNDGKLIQ
ncbi:MAG: hypothetical protein ACKOQ8_07510, partial [Micrococcales bacterium]